MIRLNDIDKTVIDEKEIKGYSTFIVGFYDRDEYKEGERICCLYTGNIGMKVEYETKEARDKDIELLDKIFDVKDIEYKAMSVEKPTGYVNVMKPEYELVSEGEYDPVKKEEYLTWKDVKRYATGIKAQLPNGETHIIRYDDDNDRIEFGNSHSETYDGCIYDEDLFNALMLKKVE